MSDGAGEEAAIRSQPEDQWSDDLLTRLHAAIHAVAVQRRLSDQEARLLGCAAQGLCDKQAADVLGVSLSTVGSYWRRFYWKLGVRGTREVMGLLIRSLLLRRAEERNSKSQVGPSLA